MKMLALLALTAIASGPSAQCDPGKVVCPVIRPHDAKFVHELEMEEGVLDRGTPLWQTLRDYQALRADIRRLCSST